MKKFSAAAFVAFLLLPAICAAGMPNAYTKLKYYYTNNIPDTENKTTYHFRSPAGIDVLIIDTDDAGGSVLISKKAFDDFDKDRVASMANGNPMNISDQYELDLSMLGTQYLIYSRNELKPLTDDFYILKVPFKYATVQKAKSSLTYPKIFSDKADKSDKKDFEKTFNYKLSDQALANALGKAIFDYSKTAYYNLSPSQPKQQITNFPNAYTVISYNKMQKTKPVLMLDKKGTFLVNKRDYDYLVGLNSSGYPELMVIDLSMFYDGGFYKLDQGDKPISNGEYYILKVKFQPQTAAIARKVLNIPQIFVNENDQRAFEAKFGRMPDAQLQEFVKNNISSAAYNYLKGTASGQTAQNIANEYQKRNTTGNVNTARKDTAGL
ncbi:MAG: hypothetical protein FWF35_02065 [Elusimicrobia bacterium]|nr:hypothetical protein [Elusimicrobiota bacterium]